MLTITPKFHPLLVAAAVVAVVGGVFLADLFDVGPQAVGDCCATEFDARSL